MEAQLPCCSANGHQHGEALLHRTAMVADARAEDAANFRGMKGHNGLRVAGRPTNQGVGPGVRGSGIRRRSPEAGVSLLGSVPRLEAGKAREGSCRGLL